MKVLEINSVCGIGSTGRITVDLADILHECGHECVIAYGRGYADKKYEEFSYRIGSEFQNKIHGLQTRIFDYHGFGSKNATRHFVQWIKEFDPDVIHLHNIHGYYINIEILFDYLKESGKPVIWTLHDCWAFTGHCAYFTAVGCEKWQNHCGQCPQKNTYPISFLKDNSYHNYDKKKTIFSGLANCVIVTPSDWLASLVKRSYLKDYSVYTIHNGIDLDVFKPKGIKFKVQKNLLDKKIILGVASVWEERKGLKDIIKLSEKLDDNFQIVLVGISDKERDILPKNIIGIERTNSVDELAELYSAADVFINTTYEDNFPTVNIEALACGTPVVVYQTGGAAECLNSNCGTSVPVGDIDQLKAAIVDICTDEHSISDFCVKRSKDFGKRNQYLKYFRLYEALCNKL